MAFLSSVRLAEIWSCAKNTSGQKNFVARNTNLPISSNYLRSIRNERTSYGVDAHKGKELSQMVAKSDQEIHEPVLPHKQRKRQGHRVCRRGHNRPADAAHFKIRVLDGNGSPQQRPVEHEGARPTRRRNNLVHHGFVAPDENPSLQVHSSEEIRVAPSVKRRVERRFSR